MRVAVTGSTGMIGTELSALLRRSGHEVTRIVRSTPTTGEARWDPASGEIERQKLAGIDAAVHLAGESVGTRWNESKKRKIIESRASGSRLLAETLASLEPRPRVLVSMSGIGYFGPVRDDLLLDESSGGTGFLAEVCNAWEQGTQPAAEAGIRVAILRTGVVLSPKGGALANMLTPFKLGLGGPIAGGWRWLSWISLDDTVQAIVHALTTDSWSDPFIVTSPEPVTDQEFAKTLGRVLGRPAVLPLPAAPLRWVFGEMADEALLASQRAEPRRLLASGFSFRYPDLESALRHALDKEST
jgi:uncharacterized protein (TIGR01777 family)